jgi:hypothetical protein
MAHSLFNRTRQRCPEEYLIDSAILRGYQFSDNAYGIAQDRRVTETSRYKMVISVMLIKNRRISRNS